MRTTIDLPEDLIEEARRLLGFKSKTDTVILSLRELIRRKRIEELKDLMGAVELEIDVPKIATTARQKSKKVILVDTSIWIEFFRGKNRPIGEHFKMLLDADEVTLAIPVKVEILSGSSKAMFTRLRNLLSALPISYPDRDTWNTIDLWLEDAVKSGQHFGFGDLLIAALAVRQDAMLWSLDSDFERMQQLGWLPLYKLP